MIGPLHTFDTGILSLGDEVHGEGTSDHEGPQGLSHLESALGVSSQQRTARQKKDVRVWTICAIPRMPLIF